jgi:hypothetical protein
MLTIDLNIALGVGFCFGLLLVYIPWIFYTRIDFSNYHIEEGEVSQCPFCTYIFFEYQRHEISECPNCHSLLDLAENNKNTEVRNG